jgi:hypothetical protein
VLTLGLAFVTPPSAHAKIFHCGAGDVRCLIDAIHKANANGKKNTIRLAAGTYTLTAVDNTTDGSNGLPSITSEFRLTIRGAKDEATIIERQSGAPSFRLIHVAATSTLALERLTLQGGTTNDGPFDDVGGGIFNNGTLTLTNSTVRDNEAFDFGGGIYNTGILTLTNSTVSGNSADAFIGVAGGIYNTITGTVMLTNSTVSGNSAGGQGGFLCGGGIYNTGTLTLTNSTVSGNMGFSRPGGGICNDGTLTLTNSTVSGNSSGGVSGGGIFNQGTLTLTNSTISGNSTTGSSGGGLSNASSFSITTLQNTIVARNTADLGGPDCSGSVTSQGNNLVGDPTGCTITLQATDLTGDPGLDDFTDDGTPGNGHFPLLSTSQAIDAGNDAVCPRRDQLGQRRVNIPRVGTSRCDIGAIEFQRRDKH